MDCVLCEKRLSAMYRRKSWRDSKSLASFENTPRTCKGSANVPSFCLTVLSGVRGWSEDAFCGVHDQPHQQPAIGRLWEQQASGGYTV